MSTMRIAFLAFALLLGTQPAWCLSFSLGTHMGLATMRSDVSGSGSSMVLALPSNTFTYQPALRVGIGDSQRAHEVLVDAGLFVIDQAGSTLSLSVMSASYQYTFAPTGPTSIYANLGIGQYREGSSVRTAIAWTYGAGLGLRHVVADRHGALRAEVHVDLLEREVSIDRPRLTTIGLRMGFDLWL